MENISGSLYVEKLIELVFSFDPHYLSFFCSCGSTVSVVINFLSQLPEKLKFTFVPEKVNSGVILTSLLQLFSAHL